MKPKLTTVEQKLYDKKWTSSQRSSFEKGHDDAIKGVIKSKDTFYQYGQTVAKRKLI